MGRVIQVRKDLSTYSSPTAIVLADEIDEGEMSAGFVVCSSTEDREGDVMDPQGCRDYLDEYRANPIVLYDHNHDGVYPPIGLSEDQDKRFSLRIFDDRITARCYFHGKPFGNENRSLDVFNLVVKGALRGASIGFLPLPGGTMRLHGGGSCYKRWRLTEWSITPLQTNQECLRMCLSRGEVKAKSLYRQLSATLPPAPAWANGFTPGEVMDLTTGRIRIEKSVCPTRRDADKKLATLGSTPLFVKDAGAAWIAGYVPDAQKTEAKKSLGRGITAMLVKAMDEEEDDEDKDEKPDGDAPTEDKSEKTDDGEEKPAKGEEDETPGEEAPGEGGDETPEEAEDHSEKQGAKDLAVLMEHFESLIEALPEILKRTDNDAVRKGIQRIEADANKLMEHINATASKVYPGLDLASIKPSNNVVEASDAPDEESDATETVTGSNGVELGDTAAPEPGGDEGEPDAGPPEEEDDDIFKALSIMEQKAKALRITG